jgi:hypothetical protein
VTGNEARQAKAADAQPNPGWPKTLGLSHAMQLTIVIPAVTVVVVGAYVVHRCFLSMKSKSTDQLRAILRGPEWTFYRVALIELRRRGEDIKPEVLPILNLLISDSRFHREGGWMILKEIYPDLAGRVPDYNPKETDDVCKEKMQKIFLRAA